MVNGDFATEFDSSLEECWERPLTGKERQLVSILELVQIEKFAGRLPRRFGRKPKERQALARALVAKAVYNHPHTRATMEALRGSPVFRRLCGFVRRSDIPSEATFSRAFKEFAKIGLGEKVHQAVVAQWVAPELVGHISRDATAIEGREKPVAKVRPPNRRPGKQAAPVAGRCENPNRRRVWSAKAGNRPRRPWRSGRRTAMWEPRGTPRVIRRPGEASSCMPTSLSAACPSAWR